MLKIHIPCQVIMQVHRDKVLKIKMEVDINPPKNFATEVKILLNPIPFSVNTFQQPDLFAGKLHAILCRNWKNRVKGRDWYDLVWYVAHDIPVRIKHLQARLVQTSMLKPHKKLNRKELIGLLDEKIISIDVASAKREVQPFLRDLDSVKMWSKDFFREIINRIHLI